MSNQSAELFARAKQVIPAGVNSPVRTFQNVDLSPIFIDRGEGPYIFDADGNRYIDYVASWGPLIHGHSHPQLIEDVQATMKKGLSFGACTALEIELATLVQQFIPSIEFVRMVNSGTEATMSAIRLARGFTGRNKILKFVGCYHGHSDCLLVQAGSGALTLNKPSSAGVPPKTTEDTLLANFNDIEDVNRVFAEHGHEIAAIIVEPIAGNMNCLPPIPGFLEHLRTTCDSHGSLLIFDEVITGFRVARGGAQEIYGIKPDLTTIGKIIGGGMPVGAFGGRKDIMEFISPLGPVYQAGTLSGNPVAMQAGISTLKLIDQQPDFYDKLAEKTTYLLNGIKALAHQEDIPLTINQVGSMFGLFFSEESHITRYSQVMACNKERFTAFFKQLIANGIYIAPSPFESGFVSSAHTKEDLDTTLEAVHHSLKSLQPIKETL